MASLPFHSMLLFAFALATATAQDLPKRSGPADFDPEPKLMLNDVPDIPLPGAVAAADRPPADVSKLEAAVERARKNAAYRQRLSKAGVLSKLEAEQGQMLVMRLTRDLENARLAAAQRTVEELRKNPATDEAAKNALADAEALLATARTTAQEASAQWNQALRTAAELRVQRERKLVAAGSDPKRALQQAETALQMLIGTANP